MTDFTHYTDFYPFGASLTVDSELGTAPDPDLAFVGAEGGGVRP